MITEIEIGGYRLLDEFRADLKQLTVVIGANAVGKSTLIDCLQLIAQCCEVPVNTAIGWHYGGASLLSSGNGNGKLAWKINFQTPDTWDTPLEPEKPLLYEVVLHADAHGQVRPQFEVLRYQNPLQGYMEPLKFLEATPHRRYIFDRKRGQLIPFDEVQSSPGVVRESDPAQATHKNDLSQPAPQDAALLLSQIRFFNEFPVPSWGRVLLSNMAFYPGFDVTRSSMLRTKAAEIKPDTTLSPNGDNLGTVLHEILTRYDYRSAADELRDFFRVAYPASEDIHCDTTYGTPPQVLVGLREKGMSRSMNLWDLSDGMLRFLCLATALINPRPPMMVAIDEPELGLHPGLLPVVGEMIKAASERTQVLVTTHSPDLLNCFHLGDVAVMARNAEEPKAVWHRPEDRTTLIQMLDSIGGETLGDLHRSGELEAGA